MEKVRRNWAAVLREQRTSITPHARTKWTKINSILTSSRRRLHQVYSFNIYEDSRNTNELQNTHTEQGDGRECRSESTEKIQSHGQGRNGLDFKTNGRNETQTIFSRRQISAQTGNRPDEHYGTRVLLWFNAKSSSWTQSDNIIVPSTEAGRRLGHGIFQLMNFAENEMNSKCCDFSNCLRRNDFINHSLMCVGACVLRSSIRIQKGPAPAVMCHARIIIIAINYY